MCTEQADLQDRIDGWLTSYRILRSAQSGVGLTNRRNLPITKDTHTQRLKMIMSMNDETREMNVRKTGEEEKKASLRVHHEGASAGLVPSSFLWIPELR